MASKWKDGPATIQVAPSVLTLNTPMVRILQSPPPSFAIVRDYLEAIEAKMECVLRDASTDGASDVLWPIYRLHHQRSRYLFAMYKDGKIEPSLYKYLCAMRYVDVHLVSYWKKPEYANLCCLHCIEHKPTDDKVCICRVPERYLGKQCGTPCAACGCRGCGGY